MELTPKDVDPNEKTSEPITKEMKSSPPTTWRPGVVKAVEPAKRIGIERKSRGVSGRANSQKHSPDAEENRSAHFSS
jgi:hypothetical protein